MTLSRAAQWRLEKIHGRISGLGGHVSPAIAGAIRTLQGGGHEGWLAGGCVRDLLLGRLPDDYDIATSATPEEISKLFERVIPTGIQHGTVTVLVDGAPHGKIEVTTFRGEGPYLDGRRPSHVKLIRDLNEDLARRDFTINAMALNPISGELRDPFDGVLDLARRRVRCVGTPMDRFNEDGLRPLRAIRFASVLRFSMEAATHAAIPASTTTFRKVAQERVRDELVKLLVKSPRPSRGLTLLAETGLLAEIVPELLEGRGFTQNRWHRWDVWTHTLHVVDAAPPDLEVRLAALLHDVAKPRSAVPTDPGEHSFHGHEQMGAMLTEEILGRLRLPGAVIESVVRLVREHNWHYESSWTDGTVRRHLRKVGIENLPAFFELRTADIRGKGRAVSEGLANLAELRSRFESERERASALSIKDLAVTGNDLMADLNRDSGPWLGVMLRGLLEYVLDHPEENTREALLEKARQLNPPR